MGDEAPGGEKAEMKLVHITINFQVELFVSFFRGPVRSFFLGIRPVRFDPVTMKNCP